MLAFVVNVVSGFFNAADQSRYDEYERDEWEKTRTNPSTRMTFRTIGERDANIIEFHF